MKSAANYLAIGEASLALVACSWAWLRSISLDFQLDLGAVGTALSAAAGFSAVNFVLFRLGERLHRPASVYEFLEKELFPLFRDAPTWELLFIACIAGFGEELLFRGVVQQEVGLWGASVVFGVPHGPSRSLWPLAAWASVMGVLLGLLYELSGNLLVPALAHALYDGAALIYISRLPAPDLDGEPRDPHPGGRTRVPDQTE